MHHIPPRLLEAPDRLPQGLRDHINRVRRVARALAEANGLEADRAELAAAGHDIARATTPKRMLAQARKWGLPLHPVEERLPMLLHGPVGAHTLRQMGIDDEEVLQSVHWHSTANRGLTPPGRLMFLADKLDPQKMGRYPYLEEIRRLALHNLDRAVLEFLNRELALFLQKGGLIHPASLEARNELLLNQQSL